MPFDQFTIEQLAGDLLPNRTLDQQIATGFNRCNITTNEGGAIDEEYLVLYARDRTETTAQVWLGLTAGCAVCHDHKFDPISPEGVLLAVGVLQQHDAGAMDGNIKNTPPVIFVPARRGPAALGRSCRGSGGRVSQTAAGSTRGPSPSSTSGSTTATGRRSLRLRTTPTSC